MCRMYVGENLGNGYVDEGGEGKLIGARVEKR